MEGRLCLAYEHLCAFLSASVCVCVCVCVRTHTHKGIVREKICVETTRG